MKLKVQNAPNLERDSTSNGVLNTDNDAYLRYMQRQKEHIRQQARLDSLEHELSEIRRSQEQTYALLQNLLKHYK